jgi:hypothetical protein
MKLYTEEQVRLMIEKSRDTGLTADYLILTRPPIELPSDEEIEHELAFPNELMNEVTYMFIEGAKWMREQILNQNK